MNDTGITEEIRQPPEAHVSPINYDDLLKHIDERLSQFEARIVSKEAVAAMISDALKDRPTLVETQTLINTSQSAMQQQITAANDAVLAKVESLIRGVSEQLGAASVLIAEAKGVNSNIGRLMEILIKQHEDSTRRITNLEADTQRMEQRINTVKTDVDKLTDDIRAPGGLKETVVSFKAYVERQQAVASVKQEFYTTAIGMLKNPVVLRVLGGILGGASVGLGWAVLRILGQ